MTLTNEYTMISSRSEQPITGAYEEATSGKISDNDIQITAALRKQYPELNLTVTSAGNVPLLYFANLGYATAELDTTDEAIFRWRGYYGPRRRGEEGAIGDSTFFAKYHYKWADEDFIIYTILIGYGIIQYVLKEPGPGEDTMSHCAKTDAMMLACVTALTPDYAKYIWVYDQYWYQSTALWDEITKASWDNVILDPKTKKSLTKVCDEFFDSKETYAKFGVAWKRGLIFHGPVGNGKTVSIKALMHTMYERKPAIPTLYVKAAPNTYNISSVFNHARNNSPCLLIMEDIETIVNSSTRSYFFNEVDGLASNDGILMVASTNFLDKLDPGLAKRPSRFDRLFKFPLPDKDERTQYAAYWRKKILDRSASIGFPEKLCPAIADITDEFSFAFMQEAFVSTLLAIARGSSDGGDDDDYPSDGDDDSDGEDDGEDAQNIKVMHEMHRSRTHRTRERLSGRLFWRVIKTQVRILRENLDSSDGTDGNKDKDKSEQVMDLETAKAQACRATQEVLPLGVPERHQPLGGASGGPQGAASLPDVQKLHLMTTGAVQEGQAVPWHPDVSPKLAAIHGRV